MSTRALFLAAIALLALLALQTTAVHAQTASIVGRVIAPDGKPIANAVVFVHEGPRSATVTPATATMDQIDKTFVPGILPVAAGTQVKFPNRDQIRHHVYSFSRAKRFELPLYKGEDAAPVTFDAPGVVRIGCNIHDWMSATILVTPTSQFAVTDDQGRFELSGLAPGDYTIMAWHELSRGKTEDTAQRIALAAQRSELTFSVELHTRRQRPATRGARWDQ